MKPVDVKSSRYTDCSKEINDKDPKFKIGDIVSLSKYKKYFAKLYFQNDFEGSVIKSKEIVETFYKMELQKRNQKEFRVEKVFKRKGDKLYLKWKGYENSFNSWIDKKDVL